MDTRFDEIFKRLEALEKALIKKGGSSTAVAGGKSATGKDKGNG